MMVLTEPTIALREALAAAGLPVADLDAPGRRFYAFDDGRAGYGGLEGEGEDRLLRSMVVTQDCRGQGLGRAMLAQLEAEACRLGARRLHLLTDRP